MVASDERILSTYPDILRLAAASLLSSTFLASTALLTLVAFLVVLAGHVDSQMRLDGSDGCDAKTAYG